MNFEAKVGPNTLLMSRVCHNLLTLALKNQGHVPWHYQFPSVTTTKVGDLELVSM